MLRSLPGKAVALALLAAVAASAAQSFDTLSGGAVVSGFRTSAVYLNGSDRPFGARFQHVKTGYTLDLIQVQSVPQSFNYVVSYPVSDKGEPHTQEHLLVGKGNKGKALAGSEEKTLTGFTAFTMQWRTCYPFNTTAGAPVFYQEFERLLDALLHPDYTDEEIRREVRNFGIAEEPSSARLRLEEKGSVYNEMTSSSASSGRVLFRAIGQTVYGSHHPLAFNSGGEPSGIRAMLPQDIRKFHREHYFLANMGSIVSLPKSEELEPALAHLDQILNRVQPVPVQFPVETDSTLPEPKPVPAGQIQIADYPFQTDQQPGYLALAWPADRDLSPQQEMLMNLFLDNVASDATSNLYRLLINGKTRVMDLGARGVFNNLSSDQGHPAVIGLNEVAAVNLTEPKVKAVRQIVLDELGRIAAWPDGSPELLQFNARFQNRVTETLRQLGKLGNSPPGFGFRNGNSFWLQQLGRLNKEPGFRKSLTMKPDFAAIEAMLGDGRNIWKERLASWRMLDRVPYGFAVRPSPALLKREADERMARAAAETARLQAKYGVSGDQEALRLYQKDYDAESVKLDGLASQAASLKFIDNPPLTLDDQLDYRVAKVNGMPLVSSTFDNMTSASTGMAVRLDSTPESDLVMLSLLPQLLTQTGVIRGGKAVVYEEMQEMLRKQILALQASFASDLTSDRVELVLEGSGNDPGESRRALEWMQLALFHPNWQPRNLPRIRDVVNQALSGLRSAMQGPEERWVHNPSSAYYKQTSPVYLAASSFLTQAHNADRLRWMLKDTGTAGDRSALTGFLDALAAASGKGARADLKKILASMQPESHEPLEGNLAELFNALPPRAKQLSVEVAKDLDQLLPELPAASLERDWAYLCNSIRDDMSGSPEKTLQRLDAVRANLLRTGNTRFWMVGSKNSQQELQPELQALAAGLRIAPPTAVAYKPVRRIDERLRQHQGDTMPARFVGLFNPSLQGGVIQTISPGTAYRDTSREGVLRYLAFNLYAGGGAHSVFTRTIGAGLAYSNGLSGNLRNGFFSYYAERTPDVTQTLHFVLDVIKKSPRNPGAAEDVIASAFRQSNAAASYETRARAIADDLTDGVTPQVVKSFRQAVLSLRNEPRLTDELYARMDAVYGPAVPGYGPKAKNSPGSQYFLIGNDKQFQSLDADVQSREDEHVYKLYPRDFWLVQ